MFVPAIGKHIRYAQAFTDFIETSHDKLVGWRGFCDYSPTRETVTTS